MPCHHDQQHHHDHHHHRNDHIVIIVIIIIIIIIVISTIIVAIIHLGVDLVIPRGGTNARPAGRPAGPLVDLCANWDDGVT